MTAHKISGTQRFDCPRVSIVTPSLNQGDFVEKTILSVLRQDYPNIEYIFVDSLSTDKTVDIVKKYAKQMSRVIIEKDNGQSDALTKGFKNATGAIFAYLNADDCYASSTVVSHVVSYFNTHTDADLIYGRRCSIDQNGFITNYNQYPFRAFNKETLSKSDYIEQECAFWTAEIYKRSGDFVNTDYQFAMDYELWMRFLENGASFHAVDHLYGLFRWHSQQKSQTMYKTIGLEEIARIHEKFLGTKIPYNQMTALYEEHFSGINKLHHPETFNLYHRIWDLAVRSKQTKLGQAPLDSWVYHKR